MKPSALPIAWLGLALALPAAARPVEVQLSPPDAASLQALAGHLAPGAAASLVQSYRDGRVRQVSAVGIAEAPPERVWALLLDGAHWSEWLPSVNASRLEDLGGAGLRLSLEVELPGSNLDYALLLKPHPPGRLDARLADIPGDLSAGGWRWDVHPWGGGQRSLVVATQLARLSGTSAWLDRAVGSASDPELALNLAQALEMVGALQARFSARAPAERP